MGKLQQFFRLEQLLARPYLRAVIANTGWLLGDRVLRVLLGVLVGAWVARYLGPERYGELAYAVALLAVFQIATTLGADGIVVREISQRPADTCGILGTVLTLRLLAGAAGWSVMCLIVFVLQPGDGNALLIVAVLGAGLVFQSADVVDLWFQSQTQSRRSVLAKAVGYCGASLIKIVLILVSAPLWAFALALLADVVLAAAALCWVYRKFPTNARWYWSSTIARDVMREAWPVLVSAVALVCAARIDQVMLRELATERELGLYSAVLPFSSAWHMLPMTVYVSVLPRLATLREQNPDAYHHRLQQVFTGLTWAGIAVAAVMILLSGSIVGLLLGDAYAPSAQLLAVHSLTNVFVFMGIAQSIAILNDRSPQIALQKTAVGLSLSAALNLYAIPRWGAAGAAWVAVGSYMCSCFLINAVIARAVFLMQLKAMYQPLLWCLPGRFR